MGGIGKNQGPAAVLVSDLGLLPIFNGTDEGNQLIQVGLPVAFDEEKLQRILPARTFVIETFHTGLLVVFRTNHSQAAVGLQPLVIAVARMSGIVDVAELAAGCLHEDHR